MKRMSSIALASWIVEHLNIGQRNESLAGDLLEEFWAGRSAGWYWRQALSAVAVSLWSESRSYVLPLLFSAGWSILYPAVLPTVTRNELIQALWRRVALHDWPYSSALQFVSVFLPAALFVWTGCLVYLISQKQGAPRLSPIRFVASMSIGLNVLFVTIIGLHLRDPGVDLRNVSRQNFSSNLIALSIPLALSLFAALLCAFPPMRRRYRDADALSV